MSQEIYSIPKSPSARYEFEQNAIDMASGHATEWVIPERLITNLTSLRTTYEAKYSVASNRNTQSPSATIARDAAWEPLEAELINLYNHYLLNNDVISASDKDALFIHTNTGGGSPIPAPTSTPVISLLSKEISVLHVVYADSSIPAKHAKPYGVAFCELVYNIDTVPATPDDCSEKATINRSNQTLVFTENQRGKKIYVFARWMNQNGKSGPWSNMTSALIP